MISVITITYNNYEELKDTLLSIDGIPGIESIVINGGSCNDTYEYLAQIDAISVSEPDQGIADAFNKGLNLANGDAIMFLNSGDALVERSYIGRVEHIFDINPDIGFVHGDIIFNDSICGKMHMKPALCPLGRGMPYFHQTMVVRKSVFDTIGNFKLDYKITMDFELVCRMRKVGIDGYYWDNVPIVAMDGRGVSVTREHKSISESFKGLKENQLLTTENLLWYFVRYTLFSGRMVMMKIGLSKLLAKLKAIKHKR